MLKSVKTLKEVRKEIQEQLGVQKKLNPKNGYYIYANGKREYGMHDTKVESTMCHKDDHGLILAHFKSKKGYNSKLKNNKNFANHYAEYIAYLILKQLGKKVCKVDLGEIEIKNKYSNKIINIEGVLSVRRCEDKGRRRRRRREQRGQPHDRGGHLERKLRCRQYGQADPSPLQSGE